MKVQVNGTQVTVKTGIRAALAEHRNRFAKKNEKGNELFTVIISLGRTVDETALGTKGILVNAVVDGELATVMTADNTKIKLEDIKRVSGDAIVAANKYIPQIIAEVEAHQAELDAVFAEVTEETAEADAETDAE